MINFKKVKCDLASLKHCFDRYEAIEATLKVDQNTLFMAEYNKKKSTHKQQLQSAKKSTVIDHCMAQKNSKADPCTNNIYTHNT